MNSLDSRILSVIGWNYFFIVIYSGIYIFFHINKENCYSILIIYSIFITSLFFLQPFLISIDYIIAYYQKYKNPEDEFKNYISYKVILYIYIIIGWSGTIFSDFIIPFCKNYYFSGYFTKGQKIKDCIIRWLKKYLLLYLIYISYIIVTYKLNNKEIINKFGSYTDFILNLLNIKGLFSVLFYISNYFPIFISQIRIHLDDYFANRIIGILGEDLDHDQELLIESIKDLTFVIQKYIQENTTIEIVNKKNEIKELIGNVNLDDYVKNKDLNINLNLTENEEENIRIKLNLQNAIDVIAKWIRNFKKSLLNIPRKLYILIKVKTKTVEQIPNIFALIFFILYILFELSNFFNIFNVEEKVLTLKHYYLKYLFTYFFCLGFFIVIFISMTSTNYYTENIIYEMSDPLCYMEYAERISNLIIPATFIYISSRRFFVYENDIHLIFREIFQIPIFDNIIIFGFNNISFDKYLKEFYILRGSIIILFVFICFTIRKINIKCCLCCCKKKCSFYKVTINDTLESPCCSNKYENLGKFSKYKKLIENIENTSNLEQIIN